MAGLTWIEDGPPEAPPLVFVHGWPDDARLWDGVIPRLREGHRCVRVDLPGFGGTRAPPRGHDFGELADLLHSTVSEVGGGAPVVLVTHDWGAWIGYLLERDHPELVRSMVCLDVGGHVRPERVLDAVSIVAYQWALVGCWWLGRASAGAGDLATRGVARAIGVPRRRVPQVRASQDYLYAAFWSAELRLGARGRLGGRYRPSCPTLFLYGTRKPVRFHTAEWLERVAATGGRSVAVDGGHWFVETHADLVATHILDWLGAPPQAIRDAADLSGRAGASAAPAASRRGAGPPGGPSP